MTFLSRFPMGVATATAVAVALATPTALAPSAPPSASSATVQPASQARAAGATTVRVGSYNIHKDAKPLPWTAKRRNRVASQVLRSGFDVVGLQEANGNTNFPSLYRKVKHRFASTARCAKIKGTAVRDARSRILYDRTRFSGSRAISGRIRLDRSYSVSADYGCYQLLTEKATGARFLVASAHLVNGPGVAKDRKRYRQTRNLIADTLAVRRAHGASWPIVWAGDYNSSASRKYTFDAPRRAMRQAAGARDAFAVARTRKFGSYNSANQLRRRPWRTHHHVDHVYVSPGIGVRQFRVIVRLKGKLYRTPFASDHNPVRATLRIPY
ncbi:endonuclease/exonuclease/phosphatase family protein [Mumia sp. zg.B17]|uniref:endonuclease/exonuclease/phosphatase family protein n=1 Tax=Mumia sp. zg.B17 TaxID=2855446 RepID=UPI001C6E6ED0|nr:endonuclease/exonuclease/phosphatase family protein [Mumia sp. zg.B17]MBW9205892.1 endonuclease/exonuclease/phosphatase family protein [Mumia sp. zg.B17]